MRGSSESFLSWSRRILAALWAGERVLAGGCGFPVE